MHVTVKNDEYIIQSFEFIECGKLTFAKQLSTWILWIFIGPVLISVIIYGYIGYLINAFRIMRIILAVVTLPVVGIYSHAYFGSVPGVILGLLSYAVLVVIAWMALSWALYKLFGIALREKLLRG